MIHAPVFRSFRATRVFALLLALVVIPLCAVVVPNVARAENSCAGKALVPASKKITGFGGLAIEYSVEGLAFDQSDDWPHKIYGFPTARQIVVHFKVYGPYSIEGSWATDAAVIVNGKRVEEVRAPNQSGAQGWIYTPRAVVLNLDKEMIRKGFYISAGVGYARSENAEGLNATIVGRPCENPDESGIGADGEPLWPGGPSLGEVTKALGALLSGGAAAMGALLATALARSGGGSGALKGLFGGDPFEAWKRKGLEQGGRYVQKNNVATFVPSKQPLADEMKRRIAAYDAIRDKTPLAADRIVDQILASGATPENIARLRKLSHALGLVMAGEGGRDVAAAEEAVAWKDLQVAGAEGVLHADAAAAQMVEGRLAPWSRGAISGFVFGALGDLDKGVGTAVRNGLIGAAGAVAGAKIDATSQGNVLGNIIANSAGGGLIGGLSEAAKGASKEDIASAAKQGAIFSGLFTAVGHGLSGTDEAMSGASGAHVPEGEPVAPKAAGARTATEDDVRQALADRKSASQSGVVEPNETIDNLNATRRDENGKAYVDERGALEQLTDTRSSRTAKLAPADEQEAILNTRADKIYKPADEAIIAAVSKNPEVSQKMRSGDELTIDSFSTPGSTGRSFGADRDARLVIRHADGTVEEVPRKLWEDQAYKDFFEQTSKFYPGGITPETHPNIFSRAEELGYLKGGGPDAKGINRGLTDEQILHRAWAEEHNQLFTDRAHVEASIDNSDQASVLRPAADGSAPLRGNVVDAQQGKGKLLDAEGYSRMWSEKSRFYADNPPEAIAQSQKGIAEYMKLRDGYSAHSTPPPLPPKVAEAMTIVIKAPTGIDATPATIASVNSQLQALGYRDLHDALNKIAGLSELLKWSVPK